MHLTMSIAHPYTNIISGEKIVMWRNFSFPCMTIVGKLKISPHVEKFQMSPHDENKTRVQLMLFALFCRKKLNLPQLTRFYVEKN